MYLTFSIVNKFSLLVGVCCICGGKQVDLRQKQVGLTGAAVKPRTLGQGIPSSSLSLAILLSTDYKNTKCVSFRNNVVTQPGPQLELPSCPFKGGTRQLTDKTTHGHDF